MDAVVAITDQDQQRMPLISHFIEFSSQKKKILVIDDMILTAQDKMFRSYSSAG